MEFTNAKPPSAPAIQVPPIQQQADTEFRKDSDEAKIAELQVQPITRCRYVRVKATGEILRYTEAIGERSDLVEPYNPTLPELVRFGEDLMELHQLGYTYEQFIDAGVDAETLMRWGIQSIDATPPAPPAG